MFGTASLSALAEEASVQRSAHGARGWRHVRSPTLLVLTRMAKAANLMMGELLREGGERVSPREDECNGLYRITPASVPFGQAYSGQK